MNAVEFKLDRAEFATAMRLLSKRGFRHAFSISPSTKWLYLARTCFPIVPVILLAASHKFEIRDGAEPILLLIAAICFSYAALVRWSAKRGFIYRWLVRDDGIYLRTQRIEVRDDCVQADTDVSKSQMSWGCFNDVQDQSGLILLFTDAASALMVPRRAFQHQEDADSFLATVRSKILPETSSIRSPWHRPNSI
jgi:hypothetical protein